VLERHGVAVVSGAGIGKNVMPEGLRAMGAARDPVSGAPRTADLGGSARADDVGRAIASAI
jgi:isocitrate/isopropylmalate dehydrogenase